LQRIQKKKKKVKRRVLGHFIAREGGTRLGARAVNDRMEGEEESIFKASHSPDQSRGREKRMSTSWAVGKYDEITIENQGIQS
jgi:hypothetical protein